MKKQLSIALCFCLFSATLFAAAPKTKTMSMLYLLRAPSARITATKKTGDYHLTLNKPFLSYFSERPNYLAGPMPINHFIHRWSFGKNSFAKDHPTAVLAAGLSYADPVHKTHPLFVVLSNPTYNTNTKVLKLSIKKIKDTDNLSTGKYQHIMLFIDSSNLPIIPLCRYGSWNPKC
jgi:hypothetical protein